MFIDDRTFQGRERHGLTAECVMPAVSDARPAFRRFALAAARRWELPEDFCETVARIASDLVEELTGFGTGLDTHLVLSVDDAAVTVRITEAGRPRPPALDAAVRGGRTPLGRAMSHVPRRPTGGARLQAVVLLPEPA